MKSFIIAVKSRKEGTGQLHLAEGRHRKISVYFVFFRCLKHRGEGIKAFFAISKYEHIFTEYYNTLASVINSGTRIVTPPPLDPTPIPKVTGDWQGSTK